MIKIDDRIADPIASIWISASAGTGKTKSLIDRILSLLYQGVKPNRILCLTYTKAAASEMLSRLSKAIEQQMNDFSPTQFSITKNDIQKLYEQSLSTEWVSIQTIHSFCLSILKQSTIETGLYPNIELCDELDQKQLLTESINHVFNNPKYYSILKTVMSYTNDFSGILLDNFSEISYFLNRAPNIKNYFTEMFNVDSNLLQENIVQKLFQEFYHNKQAEIFKSLAEKLQRSSKKTDLERADLLFEQTQNPNEKFTDIFLTKEGEIRSRLYSKEIADFVSIDMEENAKIAFDFFNKLNAVKITESNIAFFRAARAVFDQYQKLKSESHCIDYDDVILHTITLLQNYEWIMYKIDSQLEHVLVDEAQDTSPEQWEVIKLITQEFFANYQSNKTVFVVGDEKQSIFSFQGANVDYFREMHKYFKQATEISGGRFYDITLSKSYRSSANILKFVDDTFHTTFENVHHESIRDSGVVKLIPLEKDEENPQYTTVQLAKKIADTIYDAIHNNLFIPSKGRSAISSDFMILFRKRDNFLIYLLRDELRSRNIPVAEPNKISLNDDLAIEDLICLAKFVLLPEDDLTCARVLKSSIIGISEEELSECVRKDESLWSFIQNTKLYEKYEIHKLQKYIEQRNVDPYHFFSRILNDGIFEKIVGRLGNIYINSIFEFLNLCLKYSSKSPVLQNFINWFEEANVEVKRDVAEDNAVQLMTVHGSKGLQAPFVILANASAMPDTSAAIIKHCVDIRQNNYDVFWRSVSQAKIIKDAIAEKNKKENDESLRLLYVALTRAADFLYIFGIQTEKNSRTWYDFLKNIPCDSVEEIYGKSVELKSEENHFVEIPDWVYQPLPVSIEEKYETEEIVYGNYVHDLLAHGKYFDNKILYEQIAEQIASKYDLDFVLQKKGREEAAQVISNFRYMFSDNSFSEIELLYEKHKLRIDKIFFDENTLWIIDFKTGEPQHETQYIHQLQLYEKAICATNKYKQKIKKGLLWTRTLELEEITF